MKTTPVPAATSLLTRKDFAEPSVFLPESMLREARRQRGLSDERVPVVCLLDPDGDVIRYLIGIGRAERSSIWACYHTDLWEADIDGVRIGLVGSAVGAPFAVLVAEELFVSGCGVLISLASAGRIDPDLPESCVVLVERALRGEGTSHAYLPAAPVVEADPGLIDAVDRHLDSTDVPMVRGMTWTTDAPFRETPSSLAIARTAGAIAVEMEAAALYAFAEARGVPIVCFAHVTNTMAITNGDFEKGPANGAEQALALVRAVAAVWTLRSPG